MGFKVGAGALLASRVGAQESALTSGAKRAIAITQVFGDGQKLVAIAVAYDQAIDTARLSTADFQVNGRTITRVYANTAVALTERGQDGKYVIIELSPDDPAAALYVQQGRTIERKKARLALTQLAPITTTAGQVYANHDHRMSTQGTVNLVVDMFQQGVFHDPKTGELLRYNLFVPRNYDRYKSYPLVLFMHDAASSSTITNTTLVQGLGAISWASSSFQAKHQAFVLAPQYSKPIVNDQSEASSAMETTVNLIQRLAAEYNIDHKRLYATGQSGGAMMSIAMNIKYPDLFAASFLVAGQWDPAKVAPMMPIPSNAMVAPTQSKADSFSPSITRSQTNAVVT